MRLLAADADVHLGGAVRLAPVGPATVDALDAAVREAVEQGCAQAEQLVDAHRAVLDTLVKALLDAEHVEGRTLDDLLAPVRAPSAQRAGRRTTSAR